VRIDAFVFRGMKALPVRRHQHDGLREWQLQRGAEVRGSR